MKEGEEASEGTDEVPEEWGTADPEGPRCAPQIDAAAVLWKHDESNVSRSDRMRWSESTLLE